jgi:hypothetical protein
MADAKTKKPASKTAKSAKPAAKAKAPAAPVAAAPVETCRVAKCKQPVRAKGYCRKHFIGWRRGKVGTKHPYKTCSKPECRKPAVLGGRCEEHAKNAKTPEAAPAAA